MGTWFAHPSYIAARDRLVAYLRSPKYRFRRPKRVVFLCGGAGSQNRDRLRDYLRKYIPTLDIFYAERVWEHIAGDANRSALQMESDLGRLADLVIIIVESPGTFAELGAFSLADPLRKKVLPIVDERYRSQSSFISTGPLRWVDRESLFAPTIYVPLVQILEAVDQVEERISRIPKPRSVKISDLASSPRHLLFFLSDLIAVIHPATIQVTEDYLARIAPSILSSDINVPTLIGLAVAMGLLRCTTLGEGGSRRTFYWPAMPKAVEHPFHHRRHLDLPSQRADHASVLLAISEAKSVLEQIQGLS
jgi:hypothetical protein